MSDEKNALSDLADFYNDCVAEADTKGFAAYYMEAAQNLIKLMEEEGFHVENVEYLDGYFIFGKGTNSVFHFGLKECPGWSFAIWWKEPEDTMRGLWGEWFAQFTETIDKFKPSASVIGCDIYVSDSSTIDFTLLNNLKFIRDEPYLAFCRDYCYWDYNTEYHTREEARQEYYDYLKQRDLRTECQAKYDQVCHDEMVRAIKMNLDPGEKLYIHDFGECVSPRYQFIVYSPTAAESYTCPLDELETGGEECNKLINDLDEEIRNTSHVYIDSWKYDRYIHVWNIDPTSVSPDCKKID